MNVNVKIAHEALIGNLKSLSINEIYIDPIKYQLNMIIEEQNLVQKNDAIQLSKEINRLEGEIYQIEEKIILSNKDMSMFERHLKIKNEKLKKNLSNLKNSIQDILVLYSNFGKIWQKVIFTSGKAFKNYCFQRVWFLAKKMAIIELNILTIFLA